MPNVPKIGLLLVKAQLLEATEWDAVMKGRPIRQAYQDTGALEVSCSHCGAEPGHWCTRDDHQVRRIPCIAGVVAGGVVPSSGPRLGHNFSDPRHESAQR